jgi:pimeloyl-ACP methyl ester carboxylesterase
MLWIPIMALIGLLLTFSSNASAEASAALEDTDRVTVSLDQNFAFVPTGAAVDPARADTAFILYPGGLVDPAAYALVASALASNGYPTFITPMPLDLAVLNSGAAQVVIDAHPEIANWVIGGHSLGGAMAGRFVAQNPDLIDGLALIAAYPDGDLSAWDGQAISVYGTADGVAPSADVLAAAERLPADTQFIAIEGGNHAQFGSYGAQSGDNTATASAADQLNQTVQAILGLLDRVNAG